MSRSQDPALPDGAAEPPHSALHAPTRPVRDRVTLLAYAQLGLLGWFVYGFGASLTLLRDDEGLTRTAASVLSIALYFTVATVTTTGAALPTPGKRLATTSSD